MPLGLLESTTSQALPFILICRALRPFTNFVSVVSLMPFLFLAVMLINRQAAQIWLPAKPPVIIANPLGTHDGALFRDKICQGFISGLNGGGILALRFGLAIVPIFVGWPRVPLVFGIRPTGPGPTVPKRLSFHQPLKATIITEGFHLFLYLFANECAHDSLVVVHGSW